MGAKGQTVYKNKKEAQKVMAVEQLCRRNGLKPGVPFVRDFLREMVGANEHLTNAQILEEIKKSGKIPIYEPYESVPEEKYIFETYQTITGNSVNAYQIFKKRLASMGIRLTEENIEIISLIAKRVKNKNIFKFIERYNHLFYWGQTVQPLALFKEIDHHTNGLISKSDLIMKFRKISNKDIVDGQVTFKEIESLVREYLNPNCFNI